MTPIKCFGLKLKLTKHFTEQSAARNLLGGDPTHWPKILKSLLEESSQLISIIPDPIIQYLFFIWDNKWNIVTVKNPKSLIAITAYPINPLQRNKYIPSDNPLLP